MNSGNSIKSWCASCKKDTYQTIVCQHFESGTSDNEQFSFEEKCKILKCDGCHYISYRTDFWHSEMTPDDDGIQIFPGKATDESSNLRERSLNWDDGWYTPDEILKVLKETLEAYNNKMYLLCAVGVRAVIEAICADKGVTKGPIIIDDISIDNPKTTSDLNGKINGLAKGGFLSRQHAVILHEHRYLGNEAVHKFKKPEREELSIAIDIIEHTLQNLYVIPAKGSNLAKKRLSKA